MWSSIDSNLTKIQIWILACHASHITHHILHVNLYVLQNIIDQHGGDLQQFIKTNPKEVCKIFFNENDQIDNKKTSMSSPN